jgi:hypothetical protein
MNALTVGVAMPSSGTIYAKTAISLAMLGCHFGMQRIGDYAAQRLHMLVSFGSMPAQQRENCVMMALRAKCDYLIFIDGDQTFPKDIVHRLIAHNVDVVGANIPIKKIPSRPTAIKLDGTLLFTDPDSTGLVEVMRIGTGVACIKTEVFKKLKRPWFYQEWVPSAMALRGEDDYFCERARKVGVKIHVDQDLSKEVGHVGDFIYTHDFVGEVNIEAASEESIHPEE